MIIDKRTQCDLAKLFMRALWRCLRIENADSDTHQDYMKHRQLMPYIKSIKLRVCKDLYGFESLA